MGDAGRTAGPLLAHALPPNAGLTACMPSALDCSSPSLSRADAGRLAPAHLSSSRVSHSLSSLPGESGDTNGVPG